MDIKHLTAILGVLCIIGLALAIYILRIQVPLLRTIDTKLGRKVRYLYFGATVFVALALAVLLLLDILTVFFALPRSTQNVNEIGVFITLITPVVADVVLAKEALTYKLIDKARSTGEIDVKDNR
jgi:uncharacterized membrane protein